MINKIEFYFSKLIEIIINLVSSLLDKLFTKEAIMGILGLFMLWVIYQAFFGDDYDSII